MKAISIKQPWATLIAAGLKKYETRSWATKYRGPLAIHASAKVEKRDYLEFEELLRSIGINSIKELPVGKVLAIVDLVDCHAVTKTSYDFSTGKGEATLSSNEKVRASEFDYGYYAMGRYAWELVNIQQVHPPIPAKGQLSIWEWKQ